MKDLGYSSVLKIDGFLHLIVAATMTRLASRIFSLSLVLFVLHFYVQPSLIGLASFLAIMPGFVVSPVVGALLDRIGPSKGLLLDLGCSTIILLLIATIGNMNFAIFGVLVFLYSLTSPLSSAGIRTLFPKIVGSEGLGSANGIDATIYATVDIVGPATAGLLIAVVGPTITIAIAGCLYFLALVSLLPLRKSSAAVHKPSVHGSLTRGAISGLVYLFKHKTLRALAASYSIYQISWGIMAVALPLYVSNLESGRGVDIPVGILWALSGVGAIAGSLFAGKNDKSGREHVAISRGTLLTGFAILISSLGDHMWLIAVSMFFVGLLSGPIDVGVLSLRQRKTDRMQFGRVLAISMSINMSGLPIGAAIGGALASVSVHLAIVVAGMSSIVASVLTWALLWERRSTP